MIREFQSRKWKKSTLRNLIKRIDDWWKKFIKICVIV